MEWLSVFITACKVRVYNTKKYLEYLLRYYLWCPRFFLVDSANLLWYFFRSPYRMLNQFDEDNPGQALGPYGETDFRTFEKILQSFEISKDVAIADLGAGRVRLCFWLALFRKQKTVIAIEPFAIFVERARRLQQWFSVPNLTIVHESVEGASLQGIDVVYAYTLEPGRQHILADTLSLLPKGTRIITIGTHLHELKPESYTLERSLPVHFVWGDTEAYLQKVL